MNQLICRPCWPRSAAHGLGRRGRDMVDFGARRMHGNPMPRSKAARAFHIAGVAGDSALMSSPAGAFRLPLAGTPCRTAARRDARRRGERVPRLQDSSTAYIVPAGRHLRHARLACARSSSWRRRTRRRVHGACRAARLRRPRLRLRGGARRLLDDAGLCMQVRRPSPAAGLTRIRSPRSASSGAPIDGFGVGTIWGVSADAPERRDRLQAVQPAPKCRPPEALCRQTGSCSGRKQVFRVSEHGHRLAGCHRALGRTTSRAPRCLCP